MIIQTHFDLKKIVVSVKIIWNVPNAKSIALFTQTIGAFH